MPSRRERMACAKMEALRNALLSASKRGFCTTSAINCYFVRGGGAEVRKEAFFTRSAWFLVF